MNWRTCVLTAALWAACSLPAWAAAQESPPAALPPDRILEVVPDLADPAEAVRARAVEELSRPDLGRAAAPERVRALVGVARRDASERVRLAATRGLGQIGDAAAADALASLALSDDARLRVAAAEALVAAPDGVPSILALVRVRIEDESAVHDDVFAVLMPSYASWLADAEGPTRSDWLPLVLGLKHPSAAVRRASANAFDDLVERVSDSSNPARAATVLGELQRFGIGRDVAMYQRARIALAVVGDAREARRIARSLVESRGARLRPSARIDAYESQLWSFRGHYLVGLCDLVLGERDVAAIALDNAAAALDRALAERRDEWNESEALRHVDLLHQRALCEVARTLVDIARGRSTREVLVRARNAHRIHLEAQAVFAEQRGEVLTGWDALLGADLSVYRLVFGRRGFAASGEDALDRAEAIRLQQELGRALATVSPGELPGFQRLSLEGVGAEATQWLDPVEDDARRTLLDRIRNARLGGIDEEIDEAEQALYRARTRSLGVLPEVEYERLQRVRRRRLAAVQAEDEASGVNLGWVRDLRLPGTAALWLAQDLTEEGRGVEARVIAVRLERDLKADGISDWWFVLGHRTIVRAQLMVGAALTDEGKGAEAESVLLRAVQGIEDIERDLAERGVGPDGLAEFREMRAGALVSLAVNANVRLGSPAKALGYYERAYELRKDEFMRTLMACYRARAGQEAEARALVRTIRPAPGTWYNLACTHALLGDTDRALDYLEADLTRNHASLESANRQRAWAAEDPDLASLRGGTRFERLVRRR